MPNDDKKKGELKRRDLLKVFTAVPAAAMLPSAVAYGSKPPAGQTEKPVQAHGEYKPRVFNAHEWKTVHTLSDLIIPADERSASATQAGVPQFIDDWLDFKGGILKAQVLGGLTWLDMECTRLFSHTFVDCSTVQQKQILDRIAYPAKAAPEDANAAASFNHIRDLVVSGFFSSEAGVKDLPYLGNKMLTEWDGCPTEVLNKLGVSYNEKA
jgi:gluconate 2-dehydrogenase gamma chain